MARALIVTYHFPPAAGVASARVAKLAKYLPALGWEPVIIAAPAPGATDADLLDDISGLEVPYVEPTAFVPSLQRADWAAAAAPVARRLAARADAVLISGGPFAPLVLGPALRAPFVVDLRDPWSWEPRFDRLRTGLRRRVGRALESRAERYALRRAARVLTVGPEIATEYARLYPWLEGRTDVVRHGFDPDDFAAPAPLPAAEPTVVHVGTMLAGDRTPDLLLASAQLVRSHGIPLRVRFVGHLPDQLRPAPTGWIDVTGPVPRRQAVSEMRAASVLWAQPGELDFLITGKIYEYLAAGRPIVAVAPASGSVARLLGTTGGSTVADADPARCAQAIIDALEGRLPPREEDAIAALGQPGPARLVADALAAAAGV